MTLWIRTVLAGVVGVAGLGWVGVVKANTAEATAVQAGTAAVTVTSVRRYYIPGQPMLVRVESPSPVELLMVDFIGRSTSARTEVPVSGEVDLQQHFANTLSRAGTYQLLAVAPGAPAASFLATPLVVDIRDDRRRGAAPGPMFYRIEPLQYAVIRTTAGEMTACFYYDTAPNTVGAFMRLAEGGFYSGLDFFRVEPGFVVQTGDPRNNGTGGPGFNVPAEFSDRQHLRGVLSLARQTDPNEAPGLLPRNEYANSGGSQFFICLDYATTRQLDRRYTAFGRLVDGLEVLETIAATPRDGDRSTRPLVPPRIESIELVRVTPEDNPYARLRVVESLEVPQSSTVDTPPASEPK